VVLHPTTTLICSDGGDGPGMMTEGSRAGHGIKQYNPTSAGRRAGSVSDFNELTDKRRRPTKCLLEPKKRTAAATITARSRRWLGAAAATSGCTA